MKIKSEKGITGIDITIAFIIITLFISIISVVFYNITKSSKDIERRSEATFIATTVIEKIKSKDYDTLKETRNEKNEIIPINIKNYKNENIRIIEENKDIDVDGYDVEITVESYNPNKNSTQPENDLVKEVTVKYKVGKETKNIELKTTIVRNI